MDLFERVKNRNDFLEGYKMGHNADMQEIKDNIIRLQEHIAILISENMNIRDLIDDMCEGDSRRFRIPHRCPVCDGASEDKDKIPCIPCDGRGIVWG
jgi:DnaJ-class molecular chaperone